MLLSSRWSCELELVLQACAPSGQRLLFKTCKLLVVALQALTMASG